MNIKFSSYMKLKKYNIYLLSIGVIGIVLVFILTVNYIFSNNATKLHRALSDYNIEKAANIYNALSSEEKYKFEYLDYLNSVFLSRVDVAEDGIKYMIVEDKRTHKLGVINQTGILLIPLEYDNIYKIYTSGVVTVKDRGRCSQFDLIKNTLYKSGICKIFKSKKEFLEQINY